MTIALDGSASLQGSSGTSGTVTLTTTAAGEIVVVTTTNGATVTSVTASGLTFTERTHSDDGGGNRFYEHAAPSSGAQTSLVITVNCGASSSYLTIIGFGVSGGNLSTPFDTNAALPDQGTADPRSITTTNANDMLLYGARAGTLSPNAPTGFTSIVSGGFTVASYKIVSATQSGTSVSVGSGTANGCIADALQQASAASATGDLAVTLGAVTLASAGVIALTGASSVTLGALTLAAAGAIAITGALAVTLGAVLLSARGGALAVAGFIKRRLGIGISMHGQ